MTTIEELVHHKTMFRIIIITLDIDRYQLDNNDDDGDNNNNNNKDNI